MSKIERTGFITEVSEIEFVGANKQTAKQSIVLHVPGYEYQDRVIEDEHWKLDIIGNAVDKHNIHPRAISEKAKVSFYVKSKLWEKEGKKMYIVSNNLATITWLSDGSL